MTRLPNKITLDASYIEIQNPHPPVTEGVVINGVVNTFHYSNYPGYTFSIRLYKDSPGSEHKRRELVLDIEGTFVSNQKEGENESTN